MGFSSIVSFAQGCLPAANLGDDADTTAAVYGQIKPAPTMASRVFPPHGVSGWPSVS